MQQSNIVCAIDCKGCSKWYLKGSVPIQKSNINRSLGRCGLATHTLDNGHTMNWRDGKIQKYQTNESINFK